MSESNHFSESFPQQEGYVRYRSKEASCWNGRMSRNLLTPEMVQVMRFQGYVFEEEFSDIPDLEIKQPPENVNIRRLKKSELELDVNYILCPDRKCGLFYDEKFPSVACESYCPNKDKMQKMIVCPNCREPIYLPGNHSPAQRVQHEDCPSGVSPLIWTRMSNKYRILYGKPN